MVKCIFLSIHLFLKIRAQYLVILVGFVYTLCQMIVYVMYITDIDVAGNYVYNICYLSRVDFDISITGWIQRKCFKRFSS